MSDPDTGPAKPAPTELQRLTVLIAASGVDQIGFAMVLPLMPFYALNLQASPKMIGWILASFSIAQLVSAPLWGRVSDRYGRRPALMIGLAASAIAYVVFGLANTVWLLFLSRIVQGAGGGTTGVAQAYVADTVAPENRARALGWLSAATAAGFMFGPVIGSLSAHWGREAPGFVAAALCLINVAFAWKWLPESRHVDARAEHARSERKPVWHAAWVVLRHPLDRVPLLIWIYSVGMLAFSVLTGVLALFLASKYGVTEKNIGYLFFYLGTLSFVMRSVFLGPVVDRLGEANTIKFGVVSLVIGLACYPVSPNFWILLVFVVPLVPIGTALLFPSTTSLMSARSDKAEVGTTMGVAQTFGGIARVAGPIVGTMLFQDASRDIPFYAAAVTMALVGFLSLRIHDDGSRRRGKANGSTAAQGSEDPAEA